MTIQQVFSSTQNLRNYLVGFANYDSLMENLEHSIHIAHATAATLFGATTTLIRRHTDPSKALYYLLKVLFKAHYSRLM